MTPDTTRDTTAAAPDAAVEAAAYIVTITEAAKLLELSVRTVQRRLDAGEWEAVTMAGKRCVKLPADALPAGVTPDVSLGMTHDTLSPFDSTLARDVSHDRQGDSGRDSTALARLPADERGAALIAAIVRETLNQAEERKTAPDATQAAAKLLLTLAECQTLTGLSRATLREAIEAKRLKGALIGRAWRVRRGDVEDYLKKLF
jgi:excisionase family DNA binding protein